MNIEQKIDIHNRFDFVVTDSVTGEIKNKYVAKNIVLNNMWTRLCSGGTFFNYIAFGTGTGTLDPANTGLFSRLGWKSGERVESVYGDPTSYGVEKIVLNPEEYVGETITEVGIYYDDITSGAVTHAMVRDSEGNQISIVKTSTDIITIYATVYATLNDSNGSEFIFKKTNNGLIKYLIGESSFPSTSLRLAPGPYAIRGHSTKDISWSSDVANRKRLTNTVRFSVSEGNGHMNYIGLTDIFMQKLPITGVFDGQSYVDVNVGVGDGVAKKFKLPSANIDNSTVVIKVDGVIVSGFELVSLNDYLVLNEGFQTSGSDSNERLYINGGYMAKDNLVIHQASYYSYGMQRIIEPSWDIVPRPTPPNERNMRGVSLSDDASIIYQWFGDNTYRVKIHELIDNQWVERPIDVGGDLNYNCEMSGDGSSIACGGMVYQWNGTYYSQKGDSIDTSLSNTILSTFSYDGNVVAMQKDTTTILIADWDGTNWTRRPDISGIDEIENEIGVFRLSKFGQHLVVTTNVVSDECVRVYDWDGSSWTKRSKMPGLSTTTNQYAIKHRFVDISDDGTMISVLDISQLPMIKKYTWYNSEWFVGDITYSDDNTSYAIPAAMNMSRNGDYVYYYYRQSPRCRIHTCVASTTVLFTTPPTGTITADYVTNGVHKTDQYVIDANCSLQFGEG